jgi:LuxR family transcriptional regulator, activator of tox operons
MQVHDLNSARGKNAHIRALIEIIRGVGKPAFAVKLFALARDIVGADHVTAFCVAEPGTIRTVLAENDGTRPIARNVAECYVRRHWTCDPVQRMLSACKASASGTDHYFVVGMDAADVEHAEYRNDCYSSVDLDHRLSIAHVRGGTTMRVNFYRKRGRDFSRDEIGRISDIADLVVAAVWRHDEQARIPSDHASRYELFLQRLAGLLPALTERERQVCALSALGLTSEGIALRLSISINTVLTYRKRAYRRLSISSQNELMHRLML